MHEIKQILLNEEKPSAYFEALRGQNALPPALAPLAALTGVPQNPAYHAEGDVWNHTMLVLDEAAKLRHRVQNPYWFMLAALTHDFGKAICTEEKNGVFHAYEHETKGLPLVEAFLHRMTGENKLSQYVKNLVELHMKPNMLAKAGSDVKATTRMFDRAMDPEALVCLALADDLGRISDSPTGDCDAFLRQRLEAFRELMAKPFVMGRDLIEAGLRPNENFTPILAYAHKLRLAGVDKELALKQTLGYARSLEKK